MIKLESYVDIEEKIKKKNQLISSIESTQIFYLNSKKIKGIYFCFKFYGTR